jgi:hypothetical protein
MRRRRDHAHDRASILRRYRRTSDEDAEPQRPEKKIGQEFVIHLRGQLATRDGAVEHRGVQPPTGIEDRADDLDQLRILTRLTDQPLEHPTRALGIESTYRWLERGQRAVSEQISDSSEAPYDRPRESRRLGQRAKLRSCGNPSRPQQA